MASGNGKIKSILQELDQDSIRANLNRFTERAYQYIPHIEKPHILDVGCGTGVPTMKLAELCHCTMVALDIDREALARLDQKIREAGLENRIRTMRLSIKKMDFTGNTFDIIWAEGAISVVGFKKGLMGWKRFLKKGGFLALHDDAADKEKKMDLVDKCGYHLVGHFYLDKDTWRDLYFAPLEKRVLELKKKYGDNPAALKELRGADRDVAWYKSNPDRCDSFFLVMQKL
jgi:ubiquinone/menaquinone biosynthesis C-methylase UbiE